FSERGHFRLISEHLIQKGPAFPNPMEMKLNAATGEVAVDYVENGKEKAVTEHFRVPADIANGLVLTLLKNLRPDTPETKVAFVAPTILGRSGPARRSPPAAVSRPGITHRRLEGHDRE